MKGNIFRTLFLMAALGVAGFCAYEADRFDQVAHTLSEEISVKRSQYVGDAANSTADKVVKTIEEDRDRIIKKSDEMYHLFTYMISGFLGLAISTASMLLGVPRQDGSSKSGGGSDKP